MDLSKELAEASGFRPGFLAMRQVCAAQGLAIRGEFAKVFGSCSQGGLWSALQVVLRGHLRKVQEASRHEIVGRLAQLRSALCCGRYFRVGPTREVGRFGQP